VRFLAVGTEARAELLCLEFFVRVLLFVVPLSNLKRL
jgi:hypothetical protein